MTTNISFWLEDIQIVNSIILDHYAARPFNEGDIIQFRVQEVYPAALSKWKELYPEKLVNGGVEQNKKMIDATHFKSFRVKKIWNQVEYSPDRQDFGHNVSMTYEYYLELV